MMYLLFIIDANPTRLHCLSEYIHLPHAVSALQPGFQTIAVTPLRDFFDEK